MKTIIYKLSLLIIAIVTLCMGCTKDFLDTQPQGVIPPDQFYKTDADATGAVMACYQMFEAINASPWTSLWMLKELPSGDVLCGGGSRGDQPPYEEIAEFRYGANNSVITQVYGMAYFTILRANLVIDNVKPDNDYKKAVIAEAKTLRSLMYFDLVTLWGPVPLILHNLNPDEYQQPNSTVALIWAQITKDLTEAIAELPLKSKLSSLNMDISRVSKGTAQSLLGKSLLFQKKYSEAATQFKAVVDSKEYGLNPDYSQILKKSSEWGTESIFEINYASTQLNTWSTGNIWANPGRTVIDNVHWTLCGPRGAPWFDQGTSGLFAGWGFCSSSKETYDAYVAAGDVVRRKVSIMTEAELKTFGGKNRDDANTLPYGSVGLIRLKYSTWSSETVDPAAATPERNIGTNLRVIRYADVLLMYAEALNKSGNDAAVGGALDYINQVRVRVSLPPLSVTGSALFDAIKVERRLELSFEGSRLQDILRWGTPATDLAGVGTKYYLGTFTGAVEDFVAVSNSGFKAGRNELFPFPLNEINTNKKIVQNPGYN